MPTFSCREKNVTISVRCGARCRAYHASSMGEGKGPPHNCAPARFLFFGVFQFPGEAPRRPARPSLRRPGRGASPRPQSLDSSLGSTTPPGSAEPSALRTWCFTARKALILRPEAPRHSARPSLRRHRRGASAPAKP